jgi:WD40 repeat protein
LRGVITRDMPRYVLGYGWLDSASWISNDALCVVTRAGVFRFDLRTGAMTPLVEGVHPQHATASPDGTRLAYADGLEDVVVITTGGDTVFRAPIGQARTLTFSPDGKVLLVGYDRPEAGRPALRSFDAATGDELARFEYQGRFATTFMAHAPEAVAMSPDGRWVVSFAFNETYLWLSDGTPVVKWYASRVKALAFVEASERVLVVGGDAHIGDDYLYLADRGTGERVRSFSASRPLWQWLSFALAPSQARFAAAAEGDGVHVFGLEGERQLFLSDADHLSHQPGTARSPYVTSLAFSPDETRLAVCTSTIFNDDGGNRPMGLHVFDLAGGERRARVLDFAYGPADLVLRGDRLFLAVDGAAKEVSLAADGAAKGAARDANDAAKGAARDANDAATEAPRSLGRPRTIVPRRDSSKGVRAVGVDPAASRVAVGLDGFRGEIATYDAASGALERELPGVGKGFTVDALAFSPDGELLAAACGQALVWRFDRATPLAKLASKKGKLGYEDAATALAFNHDGTLLGVATRDGKVRLYAAPKFKATRELEASKLPLRLESFAFSPDGRLAFAGDINGAVHAWQIDSGALAFRTDAAEASVATFGSVERLAASPDGRLVAGGTREGRLFLIDSASGERVASWRAHGGAVTGLAFADGGDLLSAGADGAVVRWAPASPPG